MSGPIFGLRNSAMRRLALRVFRVVNPGDVSIKHHWTGDKLRLHSFKHKGYWWHGRRREQETIMRFQKLIEPGSVVVEIGGHIGYFAVLYAHLVGKDGKVFVFEPGENNLPYLRANLASKPQAQIIEKAVSNEDGTVTFWLENLSGQNNSIIEDYYLLDGNIELAGMGAHVSKRAVHVPCTTLDSFAATLADDGKQIDFVKIDVEGAELLVLQGASALLAKRRTPIMVEVTREEEAIFALMTQANYAMFFADGSRVTTAVGMEGNIFCLPDDASIEKFRG
jgi:FkbM family methyltransferase